MSEEQAQNEVTDSVIRKIKKLLGKEENLRALGNQAEAEVFAEKVQELLYKHKISMGQVSRTEDKQADPLGETIIRSSQRKRARVAWKEDLAHWVTKAYFCKYLVTPGTDWITIVGRESDRKVAEWVLSTLILTVEKLVVEERRKFLKELYADHTRSLREKDNFNANFYKGFVTAIALRVQQKDQELQALLTSDERALVVLPHKEVSDYVEKKFTKKASGVTGRQGPKNNGAFDAGFRHGAKADIEGKHKAIEGKE